MIGRMSFGTHAVCCALSGCTRAVANMTASTKYCILQDMVEFALLLPAPGGCNLREDPAPLRNPFHALCIVRQMSVPTTASFRIRTISYKIPLFCINASDLRHHAIHQLMRKGRKHALGTYLGQRNKQMHGQLDAHVSH